MHEFSTETGMVGKVTFDATEWLGGRAVTDYSVIAPSGVFTVSNASESSGLISAFLTRSASAFVGTVQIGCRIRRAAGADALATEQTFWVPLLVTRRGIE